MIKEEYLSYATTRYSMTAEYKDKIKALDEAFANKALEACPYNIGDEFVVKGTSNEIILNEYKLTKIEVGHDAIVSLRGNKKLQGGEWGKREVNIAFVSVTNDFKLPEHIALKDITSVDGI